ncbi:MAG TPA: uracil-DNA glycosylase [Candidatus Limnocylindrales bacterium]|nr:uracil-DNA glycosylase [Candidatus Limnocylindrales bacterium]
MTSDEKQAKLDQIQQQILDEGVTPELAEMATQMVFGEGNPDADIVFIGEAPGGSEDKQGRPFVGASGKFLSEMLASVNLKRENVYITNIVKYRPPQNRDPRPDEKKAFLPYLQSQLEVIQPKVVVTLGRHSMECFLPDLKISQVHGQPKRIRIQFGDKEPAALVVLPLFHPAAALYNPTQRQTLLDDFQQIPSILEQSDNAN